LANVGALILGISLVQLANGYVGSLIGIRLAAERTDPLLTGLVTSAYFGGYAAGALLCDRLIHRTGHVRAFTIFAALMAAALLAHPLRFEPLLWMVLRLLAGFGCAGLFVVTESWLSSKAPAPARGQVFAIYMVASYATFAASQFILNLASPADFTLFSLAAMLLCAALAVVASTRSEAPVPVPGMRIKAGELAATAPVAVAGCLAAGLISGSFYALVPVYGELSGRTVLEISSYMALAITGGLLMQVPLGRLSDAFDRRLVAGAASLAFTALAIAMGPAARTPWFFPLWLLLGGFMSVIYPICVAHANDRMPAEKAVAVSGRLILVSGVGSALGPLLGASVMEVLGIRGLFNYLAAVAAIFGCFALLRTLVARSPAAKGRRPFRVLQTIFSHDLAHASEADLPTRTLGGGVPIEGR
jgi:MFS family permease